jgi:plasmid replication initiation protein
MATDSKNYLVQKSNSLNQMRQFNMSLAEYKIFCLYLARINSSDKSTRNVKYSVKDLQKVFENEASYTHVKHLENVTDRLLKQIIKIPYDNGGYKKYHLFKKCEVNQDQNKDWYLELTAEEDADSIIFELEKAYTSYRLGNIVKLKSTNQVRMYEILKQYANIGQLIISIEDLRAEIGINENKYKLWADFNKSVLQVCKKALSENTDIVFEYEIHQKKGRKIDQLKFIIKHNPNVVTEEQIKKPLKTQVTPTPSKAITSLPKPVIKEKYEDSSIKRHYKKTDYKSENMAYIARACGYEFSEEEMRVIEHQMYLITAASGAKFFQEIQAIYSRFEIYSSKHKVNARFQYFLAMLDNIAKKD